MVEFDVLVGLCGFLYLRFLNHDMLPGYLGSFLRV